MSEFASRQHFISALQFYPENVQWPILICNQWFVQNVRYCRSTTGLSPIPQLLPAEPAARMLYTYCCIANLQASYNTNMATLLSQYGHQHNRTSRLRYRVQLCIRLQHILTKCSVTFLSHPKWTQDNIKICQWQLPSRYFPTDYLPKLSPAVPWLRRLVGGLSPRRPGFDLGSVHVGFVVDKVALGQVPPRVHWFPLSTSFHRCSITCKHKKNWPSFIFITGLHKKP
jgi:hypothetical protein